MQTAHMLYTTKLPPRACPCDLGLDYAACCGRYHLGAAEWVAQTAAGAAGGANSTSPDLAPTPESLMRSRYSAYVLRLPGYLMFTWHPSTSPGELELPPLKWLGLQVLSQDASADAGVVEFVAKYKEHGKAGEMHEVSRFVREHGRWTYIDGLAG